MKFFNTTMIAAAAIGSFAVAQAADLKVATVDLQRLFKDYYKTHEANAEMMKVRQEVDGEVKKRVEKIQPLEKELQEMQKRAQDPSIADKTKKELVEQFQLKQNEFVALRKELQEFANRKQRALQEQNLVKRNEILGDIRKLTDELAKDGKFDLVIDSSAISALGTQVFLFAKPGLDHTESVLKKLNANAPAGFDPNKSAAASETPAEDSEPAEADKKAELKK